MTCSFNDRCPFLNKKAINLPFTTRSLVQNYCSGKFTMCTIHKVAMAYGIDMVPEYVSPDDNYELSHRVLELHLLDKSSR